MVPHGEAFKYFGPIPDIDAMNPKERVYSVGTYEFFQNLKKTTNSFVTVLFSQLENFVNTQRGRENLLVILYNNQFR